MLLLTLGLYYQYHESWRYRHSIGCLVDDAIVDAENVYKRLWQILNCPRERRSVLDSRISCLSRGKRMPIFQLNAHHHRRILPLFFLTGMEGRGVSYPLGVGVYCGLAASTILALMTPVRVPTSWATLPRIKNWSRTGSDTSMRTCLRCTVVDVGTQPGYARSRRRHVCRRSGKGFFTLGRGFLPRVTSASFTINVSRIAGHISSMRAMPLAVGQAEQVIPKPPKDCSPQDGPCRSSTSIRSA